MNIRLNIIPIIICLFLVCLLLSVWQNLKTERDGLYDMRQGRQIMVEVTSVNKRNYRTSLAQNFDSRESGVVSYAFTYNTPDGTSHAGSFRSVMHDYWQNDFKQTAARMDAILIGAHPVVYADPEYRAFALIGAAEDFNVLIDSVRTQIKIVTVWILAVAGYAVFLAFLTLRLVLRRRAGVIP